jgi:hypothetical protein
VRKPAEGRVRRRSGAVEMPSDLQEPRDLVECAESKSSAPARSIRSQPAWAAVDRNITSDLRI